MKCKGCDILLYEWEAAKKQSDGSPEDLCHRCLVNCNDQRSGKEYTQHWAQEGLTPKKPNES